MSGPAASAFPASLLLVGAGRMGGALLRGWLDLGLPPAAVRIVDPSPSSEVATLCADRGVMFGAFDAPPAVAVLAIKPQMLDVAAPGLAAALGPDTLLLSILAGKTLADLGARFPHVRSAVRAMPNLPAAIGQGVTGAVASSAVTAVGRATATALLGAVGAVEWLDDEALIDAVTAGGANQVSGISFSIADPTAQEDAARREAVRKLRARAELYAQATGLKVARLVNLSETISAPPIVRPMMMRSMAGAASAPTPVEPGELTVEVRLSAMYELAP